MPAARLAWALDAERVRGKVGKGRVKLRFCAAICRENGTNVNTAHASDSVKFNKRLMNGRLPYGRLLTEGQASPKRVAAYLREELPALWLAAYQTMKPLRITNVLTFTHGTFDYIYDVYSTLEVTGRVERDDLTEARLVAAIGVAHPSPRRRDDARLRGFLGPTASAFGPGWDKGHFIAHAIGGAVDGLEANVFQQLRSVNRGGYRVMERYCLDNPGVLCFSRPIYDNPSSRPCQVEFGVLKTSGGWWIQIFDNR